MLDELTIHLLLQVWNFATKCKKMFDSITNALDCKYHISMISVHNLAFLKALISLYSYSNNDYDKYLRQLLFYAFSIGKRLLSICKNVYLHDIQRKAIPHFFIKTLNKSYQNDNTSDYISSITSIACQIFFLKNQQFDLSLL